MCNSQGLLRSNPLVHEISQVCCALHRLTSSAQPSRSRFALCVRPTSPGMNEEGWCAALQPKFHPRSLNLDQRNANSICRTVSHRAHVCMEHDHHAYKATSKAKVSDVSKLVSRVEQERVQKQRRGRVQRYDSLSWVAMSVRFKGQSSTADPNDMNTREKKWWTSQ